MMNRGIGSLTWFGVPVTQTCMDRFYADPDVGEVVATVKC